jgi:hypothetical protein
VIRLAGALSRGLWSMICDDAEIAHGGGEDAEVVGPVKVDLDGNEIVLCFPKGFRCFCVMAFAVR